MTFLFDTNHAIAQLNGDLRLAPRLAAARVAIGTDALDLGDIEGKRAQRFEIRRP